MRKFTLSTALAVMLVGTAIAGAGVVGTLSVAGHFLVAQTSASPVSATRVFVDGRVPVRLNKVADGAFAPATDATVRFARNAEVVLSSDVVEGGITQLEGLPAGAYSVFVNGPDGFAAFSTVVDPSLEESASDSVITVGLVPRSDVPTVHRIIREGRTRPREEVAPTQQASTVRTRTVARSLSHGADLQMSADGALRGRAVHLSRTSQESLPFASARVCIVRENAIVAEARTDADGAFSLRGLSAGIYTFVITAQRAFVAMSVEVIAADQSVAGAPLVNEFSLASFQSDETPEIPLTYDEDSVVMDEIMDEQEESEEEEEEIYGDVQGGGQSGSGGGGGGGSGGAGGGLLPLLGAVAVGAGVYAIADDDDGRRVISPPAP